VVIRIRLSCNCCPQHLARAEPQSQQPQAPPMQCVVNPRPPLCSVSSTPGPPYAVCRQGHAVGTWQLQAQQSLDQSSAINPAGPRQLLQGHSCCQSNSITDITGITECPPPPRAHCCQQPLSNKSHPELHSETSSPPCCLALWQASTFRCAGAGVLSNGAVLTQLLYDCSCCCMSSWCCLAPQASLPDLAIGTRCLPACCVCCCCGGCATLDRLLPPHARGITPCTVMPPSIPRHPPTLVGATKHTDLPAPPCHNASPCLPPAPLLLLQLLLLLLLTPGPRAPLLWKVLPALHQQ